MYRYCKHCGVDAPNGGQCGIVVGTRHKFVLRVLPTQSLPSAPEGTLQWFLSGPPQSDYHISFSFESERDVLETVQTRLYTLFQSHLHRKFGGYIERHTERRYTGVIGTSALASGIYTDPSLSVLWQVLFRELGAKDVVAIPRQPSHHEATWIRIYTMDRWAPSVPQDEEFVDYDDE